MNDDTDKPLNTVGDDALEARITAWVLGEASSFEAGELEKLCAADPALGLFERRLRVLHGLVAEDFKAGPAAEWKLSAARRAKITDLLGVEPEVAQVLPRRDRQRGASVRALILALAACVVLGFGSIALIGGVGSSAKHAMMKESPRVVSYSASAPQAMAELESLQSEARSLRLERESGVPVDRPDAAYAHLGTNSPFSSKPPPAVLHDGLQDRGAMAELRDSPEDQQKLLAAREQNDRFIGGVAGGAAVNGAIDLDQAADSIAMLKEKPASGVAGEPLAPATPAPAATPAPPLAIRPQPEVLAKQMEASGSVTDLPAEAAPEMAARTATDFIPAGPGAKVPGEPAAPEALVAGRITSGNRSGDAVVTRGNIDAVLNNPARPAKPAATGNGGAALAGTFLDGTAAVAGKPADAKTAEGLADGFTTNAPAGEAELLERNAVAGEAVDALALAEGDLGGGGGAMPQEPEARLRSDFRFGGGRVAGRDSAANPDEHAKWQRSAEEGQLLQNEFRSLPEADRQGQDGLADLSGLAEKQKDSGANSGQWYGLTLEDADKGAKEIPAPAGDTAVTGGLKNDLSLGQVPVPQQGEDEVRSRMLKEVDQAWDLAALPEQESVQAEKKGEAEAKPGAMVPDDPVRANPDLTVEDKAARDEVRRNLHLAEGNQGLGKLDDAQKAYEEVLRIDPYNKAARRGMEKVAAAKSDYYRAAYDQTRAKLLIEGQEALETPAALEQKKQAALDLMSEVVSADEPFSTFSLHVSDASFKLAHAAMERGEVPAAEGIRPEEFYNAFDYGDPAPASGEPVVCVTEQSAHPAFAQRNLLRIGVRTGSQGRGASTPLNLTLLLDHSGSMEREDRNAGLAMAVRQLSGLLKEGDTITVAGFSRQPRLLADRLPGARAQELNELIAQTPSEGGTNLEEGLKLGEELAKRQFDPAAQNRVVLFTDGAANLGDARPEALQARIEALRQQGIAFDAAGFGADGLNDKLLERLTRNGNGRYYVVDGPEDADAGFAKQLAGAFRPAAENVKVQVRFNPARVAKYKLIGFEEHRLKKEDFRNDAVDAAEMAAEEAGNALYQIETLPQGEGEVGEVSVRFRDVASGQMVERTWTIPYDAQAPAFDQATPSIQLAGLAAFTAEKLRAAPMADAVDFQQLGQVYAGVRARYPNSQPVADLGSMIGKMK